MKVRISGLKREVEGGYRPCAGMILALITACEDAGITEVDELPKGIVRLIRGCKTTTEEATAALERGDVWCSWHGRFEAPSEFSPSALAKGTSRDCKAAYAERADYYR